MSSQQTQYHRQRRRLPHVQRPVLARPLTFWPTYRGAVQWLRRNQAVIDTALSLLEIYPTLIQEMAMDKLWHFIAPFVTKFKADAKYRRSTVSVLNRSDGQTTKGGRTSVNINSGIEKSATQNNIHLFSGKARTCRNSSSKRSVSASGINTTKTHVPVISITYAADESESVSYHGLQAISSSAQHNGEDGVDKPPRIYVCCLCSHGSQEDRLHQHVLHALQHDFYVRSGPCSTEGKSNQFSCLCDDAIRQADACVFILNDINLNTPACFQNLSASWALNIPTVLVKDWNYALPSPLPDLIVQHNLALDISRASTPDACSQRIDSPCPGHCRSTCYPPGISSSAANAHSQKRSHFQKKLSLQNSNVMLHLLNGYRNALVFDKTQYSECEAELSKRIHLLLTSRQRDSLNISRSNSAASSYNLHRFQPLTTELDRSVPRCQKNLLKVPEVDTDGDILDHVDEQDIVIYPSPPGIEISKTIPVTDLPCHGHAPASSSSSSSMSALPLNISPAPAMQITSSAFLMAPTSSRCNTRRSSTHVRKIQQSLQEDRVSFPAQDPEDLKLFEGRQTTYVVCDKSKHNPSKEPHLVKWPPTSDGKMPQIEEDGEVNEILSDSFSDSPISFKNFRDLDLSIVVNKRRGSDTPDSDSSTTL